MIIKENLATSTNITDLVQFKTTANSSKLFSMLSSFLYSNKELAVLHELASNAVDAHKLVGKEHVPIEIQIPTRLSPTLVVKDYGPGLSHDDVIKFLTTYGESNKSGSDDFIGGYGIGSKSPAAVTDTWQIISSHNQVARHYMIVINSDGIPSLTKIREYATLSTGLEVVIPVSPESVDGFKSAVNTAFTYYTVQPNVQGVTVEKPEYTTKYPGVAGITVHRGMVAVLGIRGYGINFTKLDGRVPVGMSSICLDLFFNLNELDVDLSREKLRYTTRTIDALETRFKEVDDLIRADISAMLAGATDKLAFILAAQQIQSKFGSRYCSNAIVGNQFGVQNTECIKFPLADPTKYGIAVDGSIQRLSSCRRQGLHGHIRYSESYKEVSITASDIVAGRVIFVINDDKTTAARVRQRSKLQNTLCIVADSFDEFGPEIVKRAVNGTSLPLTKAVAVRTRTRSDLYIRQKARFVKITEDKANLLLVATNLTAVWTEIDKQVDVHADKTAVAVEFTSGCTVFAIKKGGTPITWCKSVTEIADEIQKKYEPYVQPYLDVGVAAELKADLFYRHVSSLDLTPGTDVCLVLDTISKTPNTSSEIGRLLSSQISVLANELGLFKVGPSVTMCNLRRRLNEIKQRYPLLQHIERPSYNSRVRATVSECVNQYISLISKGEPK